MKKLMIIGLFLCNGVLAIHAQTSLAGATAEGQKRYKALISENEALIHKIQALNRSLEQYKKEKNKVLAAQTEEKIRQAELSRKESYEKVVRENKDSALSVYAMGLYSMVNYENPLEVEALLNTLSPAIQKNEQFVELRKFIEDSKKLMVGQPAPLFTQADTLGNALSLESFRGKYVLIDFWASWCKPCRAQNPHLVKLYKKYKNENFTIIGVSLDSKKDKWTEAIRKDGLPWYHVSDLRLWNNVVAKMYNVNSVPQTYFIDPNGIIIAKNLRGEKLEEALEDNLKKQAGMKDLPEMVKIAGGTFTMGDVEGIGQDNELPLHEVTLKDFSMSQTEVTVGQWKTFCRATGRQIPEPLVDGSHDNFPIVSVKWEEAIEYTRWLSKQTGKTYRLPTEAEWEYAARGGQLSKKTVFAGSSDIDSVAWYSGNSSKGTHPVAQKKPNELGLYDMTGNVWEWCLDLYADYTSAPVNNPRGAAAGDKIVFRGGGFMEPAQYTRIPFRGQTDDRDYYYRDLGFRVVSE